MKIMDVSTEDGECQIEKVVIADTEKEKQERMPFQTLGADSVVANKKRKSATSLGSTKAKLAKITKRTTKENSFKKSKNVISEEAHETVQNSEKKSEPDASKESSKKGEQSEGQDSKNKKSTPGKGKTKKTEVKPQSNAITKFLKKVDPQENQARKIVVTAIIENDKNHLKTDDEEKKIETKPEDGAKPEQNGVEEIAPTETANHQQDSEKKSNGELAGHPMETEEKSNDDDNQPMEIEKKTNGDVEENSESSKESVEVNESNGQKKSGLIGFNQSLKAIHASDACKSDNVDSDSDIISVSGDSHDCDSSRIDSDLKRTDCDDTDNKNNADRSMESTPKRNKLLDGPLKVKKLTPKQIERKMEIQKKKEMRQKQRLEREQKLQEERESRKKEKEDKKREREEKEKALKEQKKREKEIKEQRKAIDIELKQKEKEAREEDRRKREEAKEEERKRKEEEKLEAERKKQKAASNFVSFFVAKKPSEPKPSEEEKEVQNQNFMPFEIKADMRVAPVVRRALTSDEKSNLDNVLNSDVDKCRLYIRAIKDKKYNVGKSSKTWPFEACDDVLIIEDEAESANIIRANVPIEKHRAKLFLFEENRRPPYYGTWRKQSKFVKPRRPFAKDSGCFDYEVDSDEEWEEEEEGESIRGSDDEKDKDEDNAEENEYEVDNDFMVPHGYLSDEEIMADEEDDDEVNPENQKKKLKILGEQFEAERNAKTKKLQPKVIGFVWLNEENDYPKTTPPNAVQFLIARHAWVREIPISLTAPADADSPDESGTPSSRHGVASNLRKAQAVEEAMPDLIRLLHGNTHSRLFLVKEFLEFWGKKTEGEKPISKAKLSQKIKEVAAYISCPEAGPMKDKLCWFVAEEHRVKYLGEEKLPLPNPWEYLLTPKRKSLVFDVTDKADDKDKEKEKELEKEKEKDKSKDKEKEKEKDKKVLVPLITKYTKTLTEEEKQKQLAKVNPTKSPPTSSPSVSTVQTEVPTSSTSSSSKPTPPLNRPPKRATLISVPRGGSLPKSPRISLIDKFVTTNHSNEKESNTDKESQNKDLADEGCAVIDISE